MWHTPVCQTTGIRNDVTITSGFVSKQKLSFVFQMNKLCKRILRIRENLHLNANSIVPVIDRSLSLSINMCVCVCVCVCVCSRLLFHLVGSKLDSSYFPQVYIVNGQSAHLPLAILGDNPFKQLS